MKFAIRSLSPQESRIVLMLAEEGRRELSLWQKMRDKCQGVLIEG